MDSHGSKLRSYVEPVFRPLCAGNRRHIPLAFFVVFYAVIANFPYWIACYEFGFLHSLGWFCTEFTMVGLLALFVPPIIAGALLASVIVVDLIGGVCDSYYLSDSLFFSNLSAIHAFSSHRQYVAVAVVLIALLMVLVPSPLTAGAPCLPAQSLTPQTPLCSWYQLVANVHLSVAQLAMGTLARPTIFVIVGDHTPPFVDAELRYRFSQDSVPYVLLLPR